LPVDRIHSSNQGIIFTQSSIGLNDPLSKTSLWPGHGSRLGSISNGIDPAAAVSSSPDIPPNYLQHSCTGLELIENQRATVINLAAICACALTKQKKKTTSPLHERPAAPLGIDHNNELIPEHKTWP